MKTVHTRTPWLAGRHLITAKNHDVIADLSSLMNPVTRTVRTFDQIQVDTDFIVHATAMHDDLVDELTRAHAIIAAMLTNMTVTGKRKADATLTAAGICPTGMTRRDERQAVLDRACAS